MFSRERVLACKRLLQRGRRISPETEDWLRSQTGQASDSPCTLIEMCDKLLEPFIIQQVTERLKYGSASKGARDLDQLSRPKSAFPLRGIFQRS